MTISLSKPMQQALRRAPDYWRKIDCDGPSIDALKRRGLIEMRTTPGETGTMAGYQWRISEAGREVDGREPLPRYDVDVWDHEGDVRHHFRDVDADEVDDIRERFEDDPLLTVVAEERN